MLDYQKTGESWDDQIYSKSIKAGRRTYFFDVKATRGDDYYITITESRKRTAADGEVAYDRRTMFLYKEDFDKFEMGLRDAVNFIKRSKPELFTPAGHLIPQEHYSSIDDEFEKL